MSEQDNARQPQPAGDGDGQGANKRRRRRGKRRPSGDQQGEPRGEQNAAAPQTSQQESGNNEERSESGRSRRRRPKRGTKQEGSKQEGARSSEPTNGTDASSPPKEEKKGRPEKPVKERPKRGSVLDRRRSSAPADLDFPDEPLEPEAPLPEAKSVDAYIKQVRGWQREVVIALRNIVKSQSSEAREQIMWSQPVFTLNGPVCYIKAFSDHVNIGFWRGNELDDPEDILTGELQTMRHVTIRHVNELNRDVVESLVAQAFKLNKDKGDPTAV